MTDLSLWDTRYAGDDYLYGTDPNDFLAEYAPQLGGPVLSIAEGEGRNAVFLAALGLAVLGVDSSAVGLAKAQKLAQSRGVVIHTQVADLATFQPPAARYGAVVSIFAHLPSAIRQLLYPRLEASLLPNGLLVLEAYAENQLARTTGGPKDVDMLMTVEKLQREFPHLEPLLLREIERHVVEGHGHTGLASVIQFVARKARHCR